MTTYEIVTAVIVVVAAIPLIYLQWRAAGAAIAIEKAQYDDSDCAPGHTHYPGPM